MSNNYKDDYLHENDAPTIDIAQGVGLTNTQLEETIISYATFKTLVKEFNEVNIPYVERVIEKGEEKQLSQKEAMQHALKMEKTSYLGL